MKATLYIAYNLTKKQAHLSYFLNLLSDILKCPYQHGETEKAVMTNPL